VALLPFLLKDKNEFLHYTLLLCPLAQAVDDVLLIPTSGDGGDGIEVYVEGMPEQLLKLAFLEGAHYGVLKPFELFTRHELFTRQLAR
jgi:hypothetical protein